MKSIAYANFVRASNSDVESAALKFQSRNASRPSSWLPPKVTSEYACPGTACPNGPVGPGNAVIAKYLFVPFVPGAGELTVFCAAMIGASLGFLWFNCHPAEVFMGDTGSLALGGVLGIIAVLIHQPFVLVIAGGVFVVEIISVLIQRNWFKFTRYRYGQGRRVFAMAPLHHHYQKLGAYESKIVTRFYIMCIVCAVLALTHPQLFETSKKHVGIDLHGNHTRGMTVIDTSENYGDGKSEQFIGSAIAGRRDKVFLVTKVEPENAVGGSMVRSCDKSLQRLGTDHIDLYLLHAPVPTRQVAGVVAKFEELRAAGKIKAWGVSNFNVAQIAALLYNIKRGEGQDALSFQDFMYKCQEELAEYEDEKALAKNLAFDKAKGYAKGGAIKASGMGKVKTAAPSRDGIAVKGKTKGTMITMKKGGRCG